MSLLRQHGLDDFIVFYYGYDPKIKDFLEVQYGIKEVRHYTPTDPESYFTVCRMACASDVSPLQWLVRLESNLELHGDVISTHVTQYLHKNPICPRNFTCNLPKEIPGFDRPTILFQPYSVQNSPEDLHWPHWMKALDWTLDSFPDCQVVVCGLKLGLAVTGEDMPFPALPDHKNLVNMVGQTESMADVFAIADRSDLIVTTNNCLSMWSVLNGIGATVMHKKAVYPYYREWIDCYPNVVLPFEATLDDYRQEVRWFAHQEGW